MCRDSWKWCAQGMLVLMLVGQGGFAQVAHAQTSAAGGSASPSQPVTGTAPATTPGTAPPPAPAGTTLTGAPVVSPSAPPASAPPATPAGSGAAGTVNAGAGSNPAPGATAVEGGAAGGAAATGNVAAGTAAPVTTTPGAGGADVTGPAPIGAPGSASTAPATTAPAKSHKTAAYVTGGAAAATLITGVIFAIVASGKKSSYSDKPDGDVANSGENAAYLADYMFGATVLLGVTSAALFFLQDDGAKSGPAVSTTPAPRVRATAAPMLLPQGGGMSARLTF